MRYTRSLLKQITSLRMMIILCSAVFMLNSIGGNLAIAEDDDTAVQNILTEYHNALTSGNIQQVEKFVVTDALFAMVEGKHTNWGWTDYRDNHLTPELDGLSKVDFRLEFKTLKVSGDMAYASFLYFLSPKGDASKNYGSGRATAVLVRGADGWRIQHLHTS